MKLNPNPNETTMHPNEVAMWVKMMKNLPVTTLSEESYDKLVELCNAPPEPNDKLKELMQRKPRYIVE